jgi:tetratricopeptide (TPR) repeat protein
LYLADLYRKSKNVVQAIDHIERAEAIARSRPKIDRGPVHVLRMKILDDSLKVVHVSSAETATAIGNVDERLQDLTKKEGRLDKVEAAASDAGKGLQELTKKDGRLEKVETATADVGKGLADLTKKEGRLDKVEAAASDAGKGLQELTKKDGRLDRMANSLASLANLEDGAEKIDEALRRAIYLILETDTLTYRLGHCKPLNDRVAGELKKATAFVAERDVTYRNDLPKLKGEKLREDYRELRRIDMNLSTWETATLVREGIQSEKDDPKGLLADLRKLDGIEKIPTDVIGREEVQSMIDEIPRGPGNGGGVTPVTVDARIKKSETALKAVINGVEAALNGRIKTVEESLAGKIGAADAKAIVESRIKTSETALKAIIDGVAASLNGRIKSVEDGLAGKISAAEAKAIVETRATKSEETYVLNLAAAEKRLNDKLVALAAAQKELDEKIKQPRPLPQDQLADLHQHTRKLVEDELARRGVQPVTLPKCELPKGPTPAPDQKRALYQFNQGCVYFYSQSKDQMPAAIKCFAEATRLDPNDPSYRYFLGCSLYCEERAVEGLEQVRCAAELEKRRDAGAEVGLRLERIQYGTRQWLERCRQSVLLGF